tara:strand:+ start:22930 stop:23523 length:594 start_codon:yes stop_codon:yes gene_type:complete
LPQKDPGLLGRGGGGLTTSADRRKALEILEAAVAAGARAAAVARLLRVELTTLQHWRRQFAADDGGVDRRKGSYRHVAHRLSEQERQRILLPCNEPEFAALPPGQIVPVLADRASISVPSAASTVCSTPTVKSTGADGQDHHRRHVQSRGCVHQARMRCGELRYHLSPHNGPRDLAVPLPGNRRLESKGSGLGCGGG